MKRYESLLIEGKEIGIANNKPALDGEVLTDQDLIDITKTSGYKNIKPYISKGHDGISDGGAESSYGWFNPNSIRYDKKDGILYATPEFVSEELVNEIEQGKYSKLSIEYSWLNYGDNPIFNADGTKINDIQGIINWLYFNQDIYNEKGEAIKPRNIFLPYLKGVAVLGRATPAYPQHEISKLVNLKNTKDIAPENNKSISFFRSVDFDISKKIDKEVEDLSDKKLDKEVLVENKTTDDKIDKELFDEDLIEKKDQIVKGRTINKFEYDESLSDVTDTIRKQSQYEIDKLKEEINPLRESNDNLVKENKELHNIIPKLEKQISKYRVYNLWLEYRNDGRLKREDLIGDNYDPQKRMAEISLEVDPIQREVMRKELNIDIICSGQFYQDFHNAPETIRQSMIRNIARRPKIMEIEKDYGKKESLKQNDYVGKNDLKSLLYNRTRELAIANGQDPNSPDFDLERWRSIATKEILNKGDKNVK